MYQVILILQLHIISIQLKHTNHHRLNFRQVLQILLILNKPVVILIMMEEYNIHQILDFNFMVQIQEKILDYIEIQAM